MAAHPNLERLNSLLRTSKLGLPEFRLQVDPSGRNLKWLRKVVPTNTNCCSELRSLLAMSPVELLRAKTEQLEA